MRINAQRMANFWLLFLAFIVITIREKVNAKKHCRHHSCFNEEEDPCACESGPKYGRKDDYPGYKLEFVQSVWRHGDRAPSDNYPTDPNKEDKWRYGWEELTPRGMAEMYKLGQNLAKRYIIEQPLLSRRYKPKEIYVKSTYVGRVLASAQANLAGMFSCAEIPGVDIPSKKEAKSWPSRWIPVPVHEAQRGKPCPRADQIIAEFRNSTTYRQIEGQNSEFLAYVSEKAGASPPYTLETLFFFYDTVWRERYNNMAQPSWLTDAVFAKILELVVLVDPFPYDFIFAPWAYSDEYVRLYGGVLLKDIIDRISLKMECSTKGGVPCQQIVNDVQTIKDLKYYAFSAHGTTLAALAYAMGIQDQVMPGNPPAATPQSASILFELWTPNSTTADGQQFLSVPVIRVLFSPSVYANDGEYQSLTKYIPGCGGKEFCPFESFKQSRQHLLPVDIVKECLKI